MTTYSKENDYILREVSNVPGGDGTLTRYFNFAAGTITTVFREKAEKVQTQKEYASGGYAVSSAASVALTSQMQIQKFSELDSLIEVTLLHKELEMLAGHPPPLSDILNAPVTLDKDVKIGHSLQYKK